MEFEMGRQPIVLFVLDKWCMSNPDFGISEWESYLWGSLKSTGLATCETFHFDEYYYLYQETGDGALERKCLDCKPDLVCLVYHPSLKYHPIYKILESDFTVPTSEHLRFSGIN